MQSVDERLRKLYYDPKTGFGSAKDLSRRAGVSINTAKNFLDKQKTAQVFKPAGPKQYRAIVASNDHYFIDLAFEENRIILCMVEGTTRYLRAGLCKSKEAGDVFDVFTKIKPERLSGISSDAGGEFSQIQQWCAEQKIEYRVQTGEGKARRMALVERVNREIHTLINKYQHGGARDWWNHLQDFVENINSRVNSTIKVAPARIERLKDPEQRNYEKSWIRGNIVAAKMNEPRKELPIGAEVRRRIYYTYFRAPKGQQTWTNEVLKVVEKNPTSYTLSDGTRVQPHDTSIVRGGVAETYKAPAQEAADLQERQGEKKKRVIKRKIQKEGIEAAPDPDAPKPVRARKAVSYKEPEVPKLPKKSAGVDEGDYGIEAIIGEPKQDAKGEWLFHVKFVKNKRPVWVRLEKLLFDPEGGTNYGAPTIVYKYLEARNLLHLLD